MPLEAVLQVAGTMALGAELVVALAVALALLPAVVLEAFMSSGHLSMYLSARLLKFLVCLCAGVWRGSRNGSVKSIDELLYMAESGCGL